MDCPGCGHSMQQHSIEGNYGTQVEIDACHSCGGFWFDQKEHLQLTPGSTLELIRLVGSHRGAASALPPVLSCPRCGERLVNTVDVQRNTRFNYFRCPLNDGQFITLFQFLREKNVVRSLDVLQLNELRKRVKVIHCSNCGAPIDLERESSCLYCQSPISMLDPVQVQAALAELQKQEDARRHIDPTVAAKLVMDELSVERFYRRSEGEPASFDAHPSKGLIELGLSALLDVLGRR